MTGGRWLRGSSVAPQPLTGGLGRFSPSGLPPPQGPPPKRPRLPSGSARHRPSLISTFAPPQRAVKKIPRRLQLPPAALCSPPGAGPRHGALRVSGRAGKARGEDSAVRNLRPRNGSGGGGGRTRWRRWASSECRQGPAGPGAAIGGIWGRP